MGAWSGWRVTVASVPIGPPTACLPSPLPTHLVLQPLQCCLGPRKRPLQVLHLRVCWGGENWGGELGGESWGGDYFSERPESLSSLQHSVGAPLYIRTCCCPLLSMTARMHCWELPLHPSLPRSVAAFPPHTVPMRSESTSRSSPAGRAVAVASAAGAVSP